MIHCDELVLYNVDLFTSWKFYWIDLLYKYVDRNLNPNLPVESVSAIIISNRLLYEILF